MSRSPCNPWLHRFAVITALATLMLIGIGGLVTSKEAGMSVPDWPTSYGYNMFALPIQFWTGGVFYEHTHRLWASTVGLLVVVLTRWLGGQASRIPLAIVGAQEVIAGFGIFLVWPELKATGFFLTGIGGVLLLAALVWVRNEPAERRLVKLGWLAFGLVQFQGLLGGLRVVLFKDQIGIFHAALAQVFFLVVCVIAVFTSQSWKRFLPSTSFVSHGLKLTALAATVMIFGQLLLGATMRHQHAGLAITDFPLAYGKLWPATDPESMVRYNQQRVGLSGSNAITALQIELQMAHRILAMFIFAAVTFFACLSVREFSWRNTFAKLSLGWAGLIFAQVLLGAWTVLSQKAADVATLHVLVGALSLVTGALVCIFLFRYFEPASGAAVIKTVTTKFDEPSFAASSTCS